MSLPVWIIENLILPLGIMLVGVIGSSKIMILWQKISQISPIEFFGNSLEVLEDCLLYSGWKSTAVTISVLILSVFLLYYFLFGFSILPVLMAYFSLIVVFCFLVLIFNVIGSAYLIFKFPLTSLPLYIVWLAASLFLLKEQGAELASLFILTAVCVPGCLLFVASLVYDTD